jgi:hypothetical protein
MSVLGTTTIESGSSSEGGGTGHSESRWPGYFGGHSQPVRGRLNNALSANMPVLSRAALKLLKASHTVYLHRDPKP